MKEDNTLNLRSSCGNGGIKNAGFRQPRTDRFQKRVAKEVPKASWIRKLADEMRGETESKGPQG